jgi:hypothetical protein
MAVTIRGVAGCHLGGMLTKAQMRNYHPNADLMQTQYVHLPVAISFDRRWLGAGFRHVQSQNRPSLLVQRSIAQPVAKPFTNMTVDDRKAVSARPGDLTIPDPAISPAGPCEPLGTTPHGPPITGDGWTETSH